MSKVVRELEDFGYNAFFESNRKKLKLDGFLVARVITEYRGAYKVKNPSGEYLAKVTGKHMFYALSREDYPAVGDWVAMREVGAGRVVILGILPRKTMIKRKSSGKNEVQIIATNIDVAFIVQSLDRDYNLNRFERYFSIARDGGIEPKVILNKIDIVSKEELTLKLTEIKKRFPDIDFFLTSTVSDEGINELKATLERGKTYCFLGSSGVGKSSLISKLLGESIIKTESISAYSNRGRHVTTKREMYFLENGSIVIDNPGMREVGMADTNIGIDTSFREITELAIKCKFVDCTHTQEPNCAVLTALRSGKLDKSKYSNYIHLKKEVGYYEMTELEKREKDRQFGKFIKNWKKQLKGRDIG